MSSGVTGGLIIGRQAEQAAISAFLDGLSAGPAVLVVEGQAGMGKTTLWRHAMAQAAGRGYRVLSSRPSEAETRLSFSGLADLVGGILEDVDVQLPAPQRNALDVALFLATASGPPPSQLAVSLAVRGVLSSTASGRPILVAVDDAQWMDEPSASALEFAFRRVASESIGVLAAAPRESAEATP